MESNTLSRRQLLRRGLMLGGGVVGAVASGKALGVVCHATLPQGEGPYYPQGDLERDADLVQHSPQDPAAKGEIIFVEGKVTDVDCRPVPEALVEIWQACFSGKYNHSDDPNALELDPHFQYWGRSRTTADGTYRFRTIIPGHYPVGGGRYRPPHIHFKVHGKGFRSLTTQMYFDPRSYDDMGIAKTVEELNRLERVPKSLIVHFSGVLGSKRGTFDIALKR